MYESGTGYRPNAKGNIHLLSNRFLINCLIYTFCYSFCYCIDPFFFTALHKPNGEPVWTLDPTKRDTLRKYTLSGKYINTTTRAPPGGIRLNQKSMNEDIINTSPPANQKPANNKSFSVREFCHYMCIIGDFSCLYEENSITHIHCRPYIMP